MLRKIRKLIASARRLRTFSPRGFIPHSFVNKTIHFPRAVGANLKYGFPGKKLRVIGVTGTDGKTTTTNMIFKILKDAGKKVSMISTINAEIAGKSYDTGFHVTTPDPNDIQYYLKTALNNGDEFMVLEVTSHSLDQFRVWGIDFEIGVITNITHEHLDYHKTYQNYLNAKAKLIKNVQFAVLNMDDSSFDKLITKTAGKIISYGLKDKAEVNPNSFLLKLKIPGDYNILNALAAASVGKVLGIDQKSIIKSLENFEGLIGRMEEIKNDLGIKIIVDFAHTPNALEQALKSLRKETKGKLISVFGSAGARDIEKRPLMGEISAKLSDITVLTDEDPRFEDSYKIINQIAFAALKVGAEEGKTLFREPDRRRAIEIAIRMAEKGDIVGVFGKGHEQSMNYQGEEKPWSDQQAAKEILKNG